VSGPLLVRGARVRTADGGRPRATAFFVDGGRFVAVGDAAEAEAAARRAGPDVATLDGAGRTITPGLIDAHVHAALAADRSLELSLRGTRTRGAALGLVAAAHAALPAGEWLVGSGQRAVEWDEPADRAALDRAAPGRAVFLSGFDVHGAWVSSAALAAAGVTRATPDPPGGRIGRDPAGEPDGRLLENAVALVRRVVPRADAARREAALVALLRGAAARGVTGLHDFEGPDVWERLVALRDRGRLPLRVSFGFMLGLVNAEGAGLDAIPGPAAIAAAEDERLRAFALKGVLDGSLGSRTAHLLAPYEDGRDTGLSTLEDREVRALGEAARRRGWTLALHAIGDAATRTALDAFAAWPAAERARLRPRVEHAQLVAEADRPRFAELGVIASMQPSHATSDRELARTLWGERAARDGYAWAPLAAAGAVLAFGSDAPVEALDPREGLLAAVTGGDPGAHARGETPRRAVSLDTAFAAFTTGAAFAARAGHEVGRIGPGLLADFVVWDDDPWSAPVERLAALRVGATFVGGEAVV
jgi:predicted amidohydrolase YtcJ